MSFSAVVLTISDSAAAGVRADTSGDAIQQRLETKGFTTRRVAVPDEREDIERALIEACSSAHLVITTGGTGLGPRDVTPEATKAILDREAPGIAEVIRAGGLLHTPLAALSRGVAGARGSSLVLNLPGSEAAVKESLDAVIALIPHALETLSGHTSHS